MTKDEAPPEAVTRGMKRLILAAMFVTSAVSMGGTAFLPYLVVNHPVLLLLTSSDGRNIVLVAPRLGLPLVLAIALPRRVLAMSVTYGMGLLYGRAMIAWSGKKVPFIGRLMTRIERLFARFSRPSVLLWPAYATSALAGVSRMPVRPYAVCMVLGQVGFVVVWYWIGGALSDSIDRLVAFLAEHVWEATAICVSLVVLQQLISYVRRRRARQAAESAEPT